jgi:hypothetical protein
VYHFKIAFKLGPILNKNDVTALLVSGASVLILVVSSLHGGPLLPQLIRYATTGYDNTQHVSLTLSLYDNQGHVFGDFLPLANKVLYSNMPSYPQGWSMSTSIWWHAIDDNLDIRKDPGQVLALYMAFTLLWYGLLMFMLCRSILLLVESLRTKVTVVGRATAVGLVVLAELLFGISLVVFGFASFYPALVFMLAIATLAVLLFIEERDDSPRSVALVYMTILAAGVGFSWLLAAPMAFVGVLATIVITCKGSLLRTLIWAWQHKVTSISLITITGAASIQGYVQLKYGVDDLVNVPGGINPLNTAVLAVCLVAALAVAFGIKIAEAYRQSMVAVLSGSFLFAGAIYVYQVISAGQATYFSVKAAYIPMLLLVAFGSAAFVYVAETALANRMSPLIGVLTVIGIIAFAPLVLPIELGRTADNGTGSVPYVTGSRYLSPEGAAVVSELVANKRGIDGNVIMYRQQNFSEDIQTSHFLQMLRRDEIPACNTQIDNRLVLAWSLDPAEVIGCADGKRWYVVTSGFNYGTVREQFISMPNVTVVNSDGSYSLNN